MSEAAPPPYRPQPNVDIPPAYPALNANTSDAPPAAFGQPPPNVITYQPAVVQQPVVNEGETFDETNHSVGAASMRGSGEGKVAAAPSVRLVVVQQPNVNGYPGGQRVPAPINQVAVARLNQKLRSIGFFGKGPAGECGCNLLGAVWTYLFLMLTVHCLRALGYLLALGLWVDHLSGWYHFMGLYTIVNIVINYQCIKGIQRCESNKLKNQVNILCVTFPLSMVALCLLIAWYPHDTEYIILWIVIVVGSAYLVWVFREVYRWTHWFENGGEYNADIYKAPDGANNAERNDIELSQRIPQDGNM